MSYTRKLLYDTIRSRDSATFNGAYQTLGSALTTNCSLIKLVNNSNKLITISVDGVSDHDVAPANSFWLYDVASDSPSMSDSIFIEKGRQYYVKGDAGGTGLVYLIVQYVLQV